MFSWYKLFDEEAAPITSAESPEVEFPPELWLKIYSYLSPLQLIELGLLSKRHLEFSQRITPESRAAWRKQFVSFSPDHPEQHPKFFFRQYFYQLYKTQLSKMREPMRKIFIFTVTGDVNNLRKILASTPIDPDDLIEYGISDHLSGTRTSLLDYIQQTGSTEIGMLFFDKIVCYYQQHPQDVQHTMGPLVRLDCQDYTFVHWLALFSIFMTEKTIENYYNDYLKHISTNTDSSFYQLDNHKSKLGLTALHLGAIAGSVAFLKLFERRIINRYFSPPDLIARQSLNWVPERLSFVDLTIQHGQINILKYLNDSRRSGWLSSTSAKEGQKQMNLAAAHGHTDIIRFLWPILNPGSYSDSYLAFHALLTALKSAQFESIKTLTELFGTQKTADLLNAPPEDCKFLIEWNPNKINDYITILSFLKSMGVNLQKYINTPDESRFTLLHYAARQGNMRAVVKLVDWGAIHVHGTRDTSYCCARDRGFFKIAGFLHNTIFSSRPHNPAASEDTHGVKMWYRRHA